MDPNLVFWGAIFIIELGVMVGGIWLIITRGLPSLEASLVPGGAAVYALGLAMIMIMVYCIIIAFVYFTGLMEEYHLLINPITRK